MFRIQNKLLCHLNGRFGRDSKKIVHCYERYLHGNILKKTSWNRKIVLKTGIFTGAVLVGGIFVKLHSATSDSNEDNWKLSEDNTDNKPFGIYESELSLSQAVRQCRDLIQRKKDETGSPGVAIAVSVDGRGVWTEGLGYSDVENRINCTPDTIFRIASISKSITMAAVAKLWENGDLDLDKPIQFYVPEFPEKTWNGKKVEITTRQLLSHTSGIRHYNKDYMKNQLNTKDKDSKKNTPSSSPVDNKSVQNTEKSKVTEKKDEMKLDEYYIKENYASVLESLSLFKDDPLVHRPGSKFLYTTHGWTLVSAVAEKAAKIPFDKFLKLVLDELGMENTYLDEHKPLIYNRGRYYVKNQKGQLENAPYVDLSYKWAGGGLLSNVTDLTKFGNAMLYSYQAREYNTSTLPAISSVVKNNYNTSGKAGNLSKQTDDNRHSAASGYLKPETMKMIWSPAAQPEPKWDGVTGGEYGLGWSVWTNEKVCEFGRERKFFVSHTGGAVGASSVLLVYPRENTNWESKGRIRSKAELTGNNVLLPPSESSPPKGVVVAIVVNMVSVGLNKTAYDIARIFERVDLSK